MADSHGHGSKSKARTPIDYPHPTTKKGTKMGGEFTYQPKWDSLGFDPQPWVPCSTCVSSYAAMTSNPLWTSGDDKTGNGSIRKSAI